MNVGKRCYYLGIKSKTGFSSMVITLIDLCFILNYVIKQNFKIGMFLAPYGKANLLKCFKTLQTANYASEMVDCQMLT